MKQISEKQAEILAIQKYGVGSFFVEEMKKWITENSHALSTAIDSKNKTLFGEFPKGWKNEMIAAASENAKAAASEYFIRQNGMRIDGIIWINA